VRASPVGAAVELGRRLGLPVGEPVVLSDLANTVVHLAPTPVVARVAAFTALARPHPERALGREVALSRWLAARGAAVLPPTTVVDAGPHDADGWSVSLWPHLPLPADGSGVAGAAPELVGTALAALHDAAAGYPAHELPGLAETVTDSGRCLEVGGDWLPADVLAALAQGHEEAAATAAAVDAGTGRRALHGDAHPGNLLLLGGAAIWCDLEEAVTGPVEWDLAVMRRSRRHDGEAAVRAWSAASGVRPDADLLDSLQRVRDWQALAWTVLYASVRPALREQVGPDAAEWAARR